LLLLGVEAREQLGLLGKKTLRGIEAIPQAAELFINSEQFKKLFRDGHSSLPRRWLSVQSRV
jgi:hypothetical protein